MATFEETSIGFKAVFQKTYNDTVAEAEPLATKITSTDLTESYAWLGNFPNMKEWIGDRDVKALQDFGYQIKNKLFEATVSVPLIHMEYDKVGLYKPAIEQLAQNCKMFGSRMVAEMVIAGHTNKCYDSKEFFGSHTVGATTVSNIGTGALNPDNLIEAYSDMMAIKSENGQTIYAKPDIIAVGPKNLSNVMNTLKKTHGATGESNIAYELTKYIVLPEITDMSWYLMDTTKPIKPFILQVAIEAAFEASNDDKFMKNAALFGAKSFMNAGYGLWQLAYKSSGV